MQKQRSVLRGCLFWVLVGGVLALVAIPLSLRLAGFRAQANDTAFWAENVRANEYAAVVWPAVAGDVTNSALHPVNSEGATAVAGQPQPLSQVEIEVYFLPQAETFTSDTVFAERLERDVTAEGAPEYYIEYNEAGLNTYLNYWFSGSVAQEPVQNLWFDLKPGGLVIYGDVAVGIGTQRLGAVFTLDANGRQFSLQGFDIGGQIISTPPDGQIAAQVAQLELMGNRALADLQFLENGRQLTIQQIYLEEDRAQILAR